MFYCPCYLRRKNCWGKGKSLITTPSLSLGDSFLELIYINLRMQCRKQGRSLCFLYLLPDPFA